MGKKTIHVWRRVATHWEDAMSYYFLFLFQLLITCRFSSLLFWSLFLLVVIIWTDFPVLMDFSANLEVDQRKWVPCGNEITFQWALLVFPFLWIHVSCFLFDFPSSFRHKSFPLRLSVLASSKGLRHHQPSIFKSVFFCHVHVWLIFVHVISWHFVLTWLLSLSLSRRGDIWRSCVHGTGFCDCVGVSGPGVDGV